MSKKETHTHKPSFANKRKKSNTSILPILDIPFFLDEIEEEILDVKKQKENEASAKVKFFNVTFSPFPNRRFLSLISKERFFHKLRVVREVIEPVIQSKLVKYNTLNLSVERLLRGGKARPYALIGLSGTGKSFRALLFAERSNIPYVIDDGILIKGERIIAGRSAKNEMFYIKAVKTALFDDEEHLGEVKKAIHSHRVRRILLVGTSIKMVRLIAFRLGLPYLSDSDVTLIEDISSQTDIELAQKSRKAGNHVIPVPALEVSRRHFYLAKDGIKLFLADWRIGVRHYFTFFSFQKRKKKVFEKTMVKPIFMNRSLVPMQFHNKSGRVRINKSALRQMIGHCIDEYSSELETMYIKIRINRCSYRVKVFVNIPIQMMKHSESDLPCFLYTLQKYVVNNLQRYAGIIMKEFSIEVLNLV